MTDDDRERNFLAWQAGRHNAQAGLQARDNPYRHYPGRAAFFWALGWRSEMRRAAGADRIKAFLRACRRKGGP